MPFVFEQPNLDNEAESHLYFDPGDGRGKPPHRRGARRSVGPDGPRGSDPRAAPPRSRGLPPGGRPPRCTRRRGHVDLDRDVLRGRAVAGDAESSPRGRVPRGPPRGRRPHPPGRELVEHGVRGRGERRHRREAERASAPGGREPGGAPRDPIRSGRAGPQQGRARGRPHGPRLEHELGPGVGDGEPGGGPPHRGPRARRDVPGGSRGGLGADGRPRRVRVRRPGPPRRHLRARRRGVPRVASPPETEPQRSKARRGVRRPWARPSSSPPRTWRSSDTAR